MVQNDALRIQGYNKPSYSPAWARSMTGWLALSLALIGSLLISGAASASEASLAIPDLHEGKFNIFGTQISAWNLLAGGALVICGTLGISLYQFFQIKKQPAHQSMLNIAEIIFQTCQTYLIQQGKFLLMLFALIAVAITYYLLGTGHGLGAEGEAAGASQNSLTTVALALFFSIVGMAGSYMVAWYGIRVYTYANSRTAFAALRGEPWDVVNS